MAVPREVTQAKLAKLSAATLAHRPNQTYTVADRIEEKARAHPGSMFLLFEDERLSYGDLNARANRVAHAAQDLGLGTGGAVALLMENRPEFLAAWMGLAKLGVTTALLNTNVRGEGLRHALATTGARHLVAGSECLDAVATLDAPALRDVKLLVDVDPRGEARALPSGATDLGELLARASDANPDPRVRSKLVAGDELLHVFTSGTTGLPKAARLSHMRFLGVGDGMSVVAGYGPDDVIGCVLPLYHGAGGMVVVSSALSQGAAIALRRRFSASRFWDEARRDGVTGFQYIGEICRYLLQQAPRPDDRDHRVRVMMGAGLAPELWKPFQERFGVVHILEGWSSTEANTSLLNVDDVPGSCGRIPFRNLHNGRLVRVDLETGEPARGEGGFCVECGPGEPGEFLGMIPDLPDSGAGRFEGYTDPAATEAKILRDVFARGDRWYRSGDLLRRDADDYFYFVDRLGDTFRWKSENVSTQEVAEALSDLPGLEIANVYGVRVPGREGRAGMAALVLRDPAAFDGRALFALAEKRLPAYAAPVFVRLAARADLTSTWKLRKMDLQREGYDPERVRDPLWVRDEAARTYVPVTPGSLTRLGLPRFEKDPAP
jgi:fatty-acyl-CoA synthase